MFEPLFQTIGEHPKYGPALRRAADEGSVLLLNYHTHGPGEPYCISVLARKKAFLSFLGEPGDVEELVHVRGFGRTAEECGPLTRAFAEELQSHYDVTEPPEIYLDGVPFAEDAPTPPTASPPIEGPQPHAETNAMYDPVMVQPMRDEVTRLGATELHTAEDVDAALKQPGSTLVFVNSVCGCAAAGARPGLALAWMQEKKPDRLVTVFAGMEREAVERAREYFKPYMPSSPQIALMRDGEIVHMWQRHDIEGREPATLAQNMAEVFQQNC